MTLSLPTETVLPTCLIAKNTFLAIKFDDYANDVPQRRSSSLPPRLHSHCDSSEQVKVSDGLDSDAMSTEASWEEPCFSDSEITENSDPPTSGTSVKDLEESFLPTATSVTPTRTRLNSKATCWQPSVPPPPPPPPLQESVPMWKLGMPKSKKCWKLWAEGAELIVKETRKKLLQLECVDDVEYKLQDKAWKVTIHCLPENFGYSQRMQTVAKQSFLQFAEESRNGLYVLGYQGIPFQPIPNGFFASLGSMKSESEACWDVYTHGVCPRGCDCPWEHPALVHTITVVVEPSKAPTKEGARLTAQEKNEIRFGDF